MFQSSPQITPCPFSLLCHRSKSEKVFLDKRPTILGLISYMCITPYPLPEFHFWTAKSKNKTDLHFMTYWHQLDVRCYVSFKVQTFYCEKITFCLTKTEKMVNSKYRYFAIILRGVLQYYWRELLKMLGGIMQKYWEIIWKKCSGTLSASLYIIASFSKIINDQWERSHWQIFDTHFNIKMVIQKTRRVMIYKY